jgi:hypothetical protein
MNSGRTPRVTLAILAKQKEHVLPYYLSCLENLDYPKDLISLYIRTNNNTDRTADILRDWAEKVRSEYEHVHFDERNVEAKIEQYGIHEWNAERFTVLGEIRQKSLHYAIERKSDFYFVVDVDNFILPDTLRDLVNVNLPIVAPLLRNIDSRSMYSNFHAAIDSNGYYAQSAIYGSLLYREFRGLAEVPVVHCTYLVRADALPKLTYDDGSKRFEYVIFSDSARRAHVLQYLDTRKVYGYLTFEENHIGVPEQMELLETENIEKIW